MLTITGEIETIELGREYAAPAGSSFAPALPPSRRRLPDGLPPDLWYPAARRRDALALVCPETRGASAVIDARRLKVYYANDEARRLFAARRPFRVDSGTLMVSPGATERVRQAFAAAQEGGAQLIILDDELAGAASMRIAPLDLGDERLPGLTLVDFAAERVSLGPEELAALARGFGLTEAEAAIAGLMVDGLSLERIAEVRGVQRETVRNQCKTLLGKMHCHRQVDLVRMALSLCARPASAAHFQPK